MCRQGVVCGGGVASSVVLNCLRSLSLCAGLNVVLGRVGGCARLQCGHSERERLVAQTMPYLLVKSLTSGKQADVRPTNPDELITMVKVFSTCQQEKPTTTTHNNPQSPQQQTKERNKRRSAQKSVCRLEIRYISVFFLV